MTNRSRLLRLVPAVVSLCVLAAPAFSEQQRPAKPASAELPGVEGNYSIVTPAPEPLEAPLEAPADGYTFKAGNTDIRISGSVSFEIGTGLSHEGGQQRR